MSLPSQCRLHGSAPIGTPFGHGGAVAKQFVQLCVYMLRAIDGSARSIDRAARSIDPSIAQQSTDSAGYRPIPVIRRTVDRAALSIDTGNLQNGRSCSATDRS